MSRLIVAVSHVEFTEADQTLYVIKVHQDGEEWQVRRTYSNFRQLRDDIHKVTRDTSQIVDDTCSIEFINEFHALAFPSKRLFGSKKDHVVKERAMELHHFLIKLLFLTHAYRKAQKTKYDQVHNAETRAQGSINVFYLLRDFLTPNKMQDGALNQRHQMLRESKILSMRTSQQNRAMSASHLLPSREHGTPPIPEHTHTGPLKRSTSASIQSQTLDIAALMGKDKRTTKASPRSTRSRSQPMLKLLDSDVDLSTRSTAKMSISSSSSSSIKSVSPSIKSVSPSLPPRQKTVTTETTRRRTRRKPPTTSTSTIDQEVRTSERLSRLNPQLTAQAITINAQKELERAVSEYNAIMILRYVDRFISKAVGKAPGCYTVVGPKLVIDSARFVSEVEEVFTDLPDGFQNVFKDTVGEWIFPKALDAYVQMKWNSFQIKPATNETKHSDSDDSDSEYEYESVGYTKKKNTAFSQEESDVLQKMISEGTASSSQMLRLRRQFDESGWRRPSRRPRNINRVNEILSDSDDSSEEEDGNASSSKGQALSHKQVVEKNDKRLWKRQGGDNLIGSDTDEEDTHSGNDVSVKQFQEQRNRMRKIRLNRPSIGSNA